MIEINKSTILNVTIGILVSAFFIWVGYLFIQTKTITRNNQVTLEQVVQFINNSIKNSNPEAVAPQSQPQPTDPKAK